jgi:hypothetical protein
MSSTSNAKIDAAIDTAISQIPGPMLDRQALSTARANAALWAMGFDLLVPCGRGTARYQVVRAIYG